MATVHSPPPVSSSAGPRHAAAAARSRASAHSGPLLPWWRVPTVWLVIGGPAAVVVAGFATLAIAAIGADPVLRPPPAALAGAAAPALQGRNHMATGGRPGAAP